MKFQPGRPIEWSLSLNWINTDKITFCVGVWTIERNIHVVWLWDTMFPMNFTYKINYNSKIHIKGHNISKDIVNFLHLFHWIIGGIGVAIKWQPTTNSTESHSRTYTKWLFYFNDCWHPASAHRVHMQIEAVCQHWMCMNILTSPNESTA